YVDLRVELAGPEAARISIGECPAFDEKDDYSWFAGLEKAPHPALDAIARATNPRARCRPVESRRGLAWEVIIDPGSEPRPAPPELALARLSRGASFALEQRRPLRS
ncbi:MAG: hypothetical protein NZ990_04265, partial [Myxococcota bacterium]|nr:hypothetical protein [Myxococcota bacterium]